MLPWAIWAMDHAYTQRNRILKENFASIQNTILSCTRHWINIIVSIGENDYYFCVTYFPTNIMLCCEHIQFFDSQNIEAHNPMCMYEYGMYGSIQPFSIYKQTYCIIKLDQQKISCKRVRIRIRIRAKYEVGIALEVCRECSRIGLQMAIWIHLIT